MENMHQERYEMLHKAASKMANADAIPNEMRDILHRAAEPWAPGDSIKAAIDRAARRTGLGYRRVRTLWYLQTRAVLATEADALRSWHRNWMAAEKQRLTAQLAELETNWKRIGGDE